MKFLQPLGFRNADEMDMYISLVAVRTSWLVITIALLIWSLYDVATKGAVTRPLILLGIGQAVYFSTIRTMRKKLSGDNQEQNP
jgi:hypothetical protein